LPGSKLNSAVNAVHGWRQDKHAKRINFQPDCIPNFRGVPGDWSGSYARNYTQKIMLLHNWISSWAGWMQHTNIHFPLDLSWARFAFCISAEIQCDRQQTEPQTVLLCFWPQDLGSSIQWVTFIFRNGERAGIVQVGAFICVISGQVASATWLPVGF